MDKYYCTSSSQHCQDSGWEQCEYCLWEDYLNRKRIVEQFTRDHFITWKNLPPAIAENLANFLEAPEIIEDEEAPKDMSDKQPEWYWKVLCFFPKLPGELKREEIMEARNKRRDSLNRNSASTEDFARLNFAYWEALKHATN